jgi:hypothetical protein
VKKSSPAVWLTLWFVAAFLLVEVFFGTDTWSMLKVNLLDLADTELEGQAIDLQRFLEARKDLPEEELQAQLADKYNANNDEPRSYIEITSTSGQTVYRSKSLAGSTLPPVTSDELDRRTYTGVAIGSEPFRLMTEQVGAPGHAYIVRIGLPMALAIETLRAFRSRSLWSCVLVIVLAVSGGYWIYRRAERRSD